MNSSRLGRKPSRPPFRPRDVDDDDDAGFRSSLKKKKKDSLVTGPSDRRKIDGEDEGPPGGRKVFEKNRGDREVKLSLSQWVFLTEGS